MEAERLKKELNYFMSMKEELLGKAKGEFALIHEEKLIGTFKSKQDAIKRGYELFCNTPFLVKLITEIEDVQNFTSNLISCM